MGTEDTIKDFEKIIKNYYEVELLENIRVGKNYLIMNYSDIAKSDLLLAHSLLDEPEEFIKAAEISAERIAQIQKNAKEIKIRIKNIPKTQIEQSSNLRSKHLGKFICIEGVIRQKSDIRPQVTASRFECPSCGNIIPVLQIDKKFKEPSRCGCGRKGRFKIISKTLIDAQNMVIEEDINSLEGGAQPKRTNVIMKEDLITPLLEKKSYPGSKIRINGFLKECPVILKGGGQSTRYDWILEANYFEPVEEEFGDVVITDEEKEEIHQISKNENLMDLLVNSLAPSIYGHDEIKKSLLVQLVGGVKKELDDGTSTRGDMHILLIGDPGAAKSKLLKRINVVAPKSRFVSGKGSSGAGITAAVVKDEFLGGWTLEAGAMVLANRGIICIDELDKMSKEDTSSMHEAMEGQTIPISKANIQATLKCETTVLAAANPITGQFNLYGKSYAEQFGLPVTLINRFDLIFIIIDKPESKRDSKLAKFVSSIHRNGNKKKSSSKTEIDNTNNSNQKIETIKLRKYLAYAKNIQPEITDEAEEEYINYYLDMRSRSENEGSNRTVPISARQLEALIRMAEAFAKLRLSDTVDKEDAKNATQLMDFCIKKIALDEHTGKVDLSNVATGMTSDQRSVVTNIRQIISNLEDQFGKEIPIDEIVLQAKENNIDEEKINDTISKLRRTGDIFEPKRGYIQKI